MEALLRVILGIQHYPQKPRYGHTEEKKNRSQQMTISDSLSLLCLLQSSTSFNRDAVKAGTGRRFLGGLLDHTSYCYTLEVSFYSYIIGGTTAAVPYTEEACILGKFPPGPIQAK